MLIDKIFPKQCQICNAKGDYLCKKCKKTLKPHPEICPYCHKFSADYKACLDCKMQRENYLEGIIIPFRYTEALKKMILKLKYSHKWSVADFLVDRLYLAFLADQQLQRDIAKGKLIVSFVPSHRRRHYFIKGYNQSEVLAKRFAKKYDFEFQKLCKKTKNTKSQAKLSRMQRLKNLKNAFVVEKSLDLKGDEIVVLMDDITTTGSSLNELAKTMKKMYPKLKIRGLVVGRHAG